LIENQDAEVKRVAFVDMVRTALIVSLQTDGGSATALLSVVQKIGALNRVSLRIPADLSASEAASEYMISQWEQFEDFRAEPDYVHPTWTGQTSVGEIRARIASSETEVLIDGVWQFENPALRDLPGDDGNTLKLLAHIRDRASATMSDLEKVLPHVNRRSIGRLLKASAAKDHLVEMTGAGRGVVWRATLALINQRPASARLIESPKIVELPAPQKRKIDPLEKKVLTMIRRHGGVTNAEVRKEAPHLSNHHVRRLLQRLRNEGLIYVEGTTKSAVWRLVGKAP
jgi:hypothetical protein